MCGKQARGACKHYACKMLSKRLRTRENESSKQIAASKERVEEKRSRREKDCKADKLSVAGAQGATRRRKERGKGRNKKGRETMEGKQFGLPRKKGTSGKHRCQQTVTVNCRTEDSSLREVNGLTQRATRDNGHGNKRGLTLAAKKTAKPFESLALHVGETNLQRSRSPGAACCKTLSFLPGRTTGGNRSGP